MVINRTKAATVAAAIGMTVAASFYAVSDGSDSTYAVRSIYVIDGDTIAVGKERIRIMGLDAPEIHGHQCEQELILGLRAKERLAELMRPPHHVRISRSLHHDKYGRTLAVVRSDGHDVADVLISNGLARPYNGHGKRQGWC